MLIIPYNTIGGYSLIVPGHHYLHVVKSLEVKL